MRIPGLLALAAALVLLPCLASAQNPRNGERPEKELFLWSQRLVPDSTTPTNWTVATPVIDYTVGLFDPRSSNPPLQFMESEAGHISLHVKTGLPFVVGYSVFPIYQNSPPGAWDDWGPNAQNPITMDSPITRGPQQLYVNERDMWADLGQQYRNLTAWQTMGQMMPPGGGQNAMYTWHYGKFWDKFTAAVVARIGLPTDVTGSLVAINVVIQAGVCHTNGSSPTDPLIDLSNAIVLQILPGPPIKIQLSGNGGPGNWGTAGDTFSITGINMSPSMTVGFFNGLTNRTWAPISMLDGENAEVTIPAAAVTGTLVFQSALGTGQTLHNVPFPFIRTAGPLFNTSIAGTISWGTDNDPDGLVVYGATVVGLATPTGITVPLGVPPLSLTGELEVRIFRFRPDLPVAALVLPGDGVFPLNFEAHLANATPGLAMLPVSIVNSVELISTVITGVANAYSVTITSTAAVTTATTPFFMTVKFRPTPTSPALGGL